MPKLKENESLSPGDTVGYLTLRKKIKKNGYPHWECDCACGASVIRRQEYIGRALRGDRTSSCGCQHPQKTNTGENSNGWRGVGNLPGQHFAAIYHSSLIRKLPFEITIEDAWFQFQKQNGRCALTGLPLCFVGQRQKKKTAEGQTASLDRIDSSKGYTKDNICWVHKTVNHMKNKYSVERFLEICQLVTEHRNAALAC